MYPRLEHLQHQTRRHFLSSAGQFSLGAIAMQALGEKAAAAAPVANPFAA